MNVHMLWTDGGIMCPVVASVLMVKRVVNTVAGATIDTTVCTYLNDGVTKQLDSSQARL